MDRRLVINLVTFFAVATGIIGYGFLNLFGNPFLEPVTLVTRMPETAGLRPGFSVTLDGVVVGTVDRVELVEDGVDITIALDEGREVPGDAEARIVRASAIGEQRIDLSPTQGGTAPPYPDGSRVPAAEDAVPPNVEEVITTVQDLLRAIPTEDLNTVISETATALRGRADDIHSLVRSTEIITTELLRRDDDLRALFENAPPVLDDLTESGDDIRAAVENTRLVTAILADRRTDIVELLRDGSTLAELADPILLDTRADLHCLVGSLGTLVTQLDGATLADLDRGLQLSETFFGIIDDVAVQGHTEDVGHGGGTRDDQTWLRTQLLLPPPGPPGLAYDPKVATPTTRLGEACDSPFAGGTGAPRQQDPAPVEAGGRIVDASGRPVDGELAAPPADGVGEQDRTARTSNPPLIPIVALGVGGAVLLWIAGPRARRPRRTRT
ncbi:MCE family protein [Iamia sp. SCSIO 61187]|uniref:MCE family protein n=1 Tax=Iamia sp. SCSIO 61187 TaxID=2722752 RepID=UPI001C62C241|nr:MCE family protein [Iamia sp. SCSIO 61187]QYG92931.1 MCE family protein [Iamia sp. SCSIO 61187]